MASLDADQKKKLYILLGLAGLLGLGLVFVFLRGGAKTSTESGVGTPSAMGSGTGAPASPTRYAKGDTGGMGGAAPATSTAGAAAGAPAPVGTPSAHLVATERFRDDPFQPEVIPPTPAPPPAPTPTAIPPAVPVPQPQFASGVAVPGVNGGAASALSHSPLLVNLPPVRISAMSNPTNSPDTSVPVAIPGSTSSVLPRSPNKRISGIVIGNTVRALIEITDTEGNVVTRVVQPGDEIEGIKILRVERVREGDRNVTRMIVREEGEERVVELKPSTAQSQNGTGGAGGAGGYPGGGGGGYPGGGGVPGGGRSFAPRPPI